MTAGPVRALVKVRTHRGSYPGEALPLAEASELTEQLRQQVVDCGDGCEFVSFRGHDGRQVHVRGREVISVECAPESSDRLHRRPAASGGYDARETDRGLAPVGSLPTQGGAVFPGATLTVHAGAPSGVDEATAWLRQQAAHRGATGGIRR